MLEQYGIYLRNTKQPTTIPGYISRAKKWIQYLEDNNLTFKTSSPIDVYSFLDKQDWKDSTKESFKITILSFYNFLTDVSNELETNQMHKGVKIKQVDTETLPFTKEEVDKIFAFLKSEQRFKDNITKYRWRWDYYVAACIFIDTGLRIKHLLEITVDQCNLSHKTINFPASRYKKKGTPKVAFISETTTAAIRRLRRNKDRDDKLFNISQTTLRDVFRQAGVILRFKIHPHRFRATWGTEFDDKIGSFPALKEQGGWRSDSSALRYVHGAGVRSEDDIRKEMFGD